MRGEVLGVDERGGVGDRDLGFLHLGLLGLLGRLGLGAVLPRLVVVGALVGGAGAPGDAGVVVVVAGRGVPGGLDRSYM